MKRVLVLGSTGSIGTQALDVISASDGLQVVGLSADSSWEPLLEQARQHGVPAIALADPEAGERASSIWDGQVLAGEEVVRELIVQSKPDLVLNAVVGAAGLGPTIVTLTEGIDLALANKESLVIGGELVTALAEATNAQIVPVDSEHSALYQLIRSEQPGTVERLVLTASGGPFRGRTDLAGVSPDEALAHPTWEMGGRITIDSATLMNKGFEMIEAHHLFGVPLRADRCRRAPAVDRPRARPPERRRLTGSPRLPRHASADLLRAPPTRACRRRRADAGPGERRRAQPSSRTPTPSPAFAWPARPGRSGGRRRAS